MNNPDDFLDLFDTPAPKPAQAPAPSPVEEAKPSMFDGVLDEFETEAEELEPVVEQVEAPEEAKPEPEVGYDMTLNAPMAVSTVIAVAEPEVQPTIIEHLLERGEREPVQDPPEALAHLERDWHASPAPVEQRMVLVHTPEDRSAVLNALPATVPASAVRVVKPERSRRPLWIGAGLAVFAIGGAVAWLHTNKESTRAVVVETPVQAPKVEAPAPIPAPSPVAVEPRVIEQPVKVEPVVEPVKEESVAVAQVEPAKVEPKPAPKKSSTKPKTMPAPAKKPATPEPTWQDDAMDKLDALEKRL